MTEVQNGDTLAVNLGLSIVTGQQPSGDPVMEYSDEEVRGRFSGVEFVIGSTASQGVGMLFVTTKRVIWMNGSTERAGKGYAMEYRIIAMHAVSRDPEIAPRDCIYIQLDSPIDDDPRFNEEGGDDDENSDAGGEVVEPELKIIPTQRESVEEIFRVLSDCAALNPDPDSGDSDQGGFFYDMDSALSNMNAAGLENALEGLHFEDGNGDLAELLGDDPERFEDAEEDTEDDPRPNGWSSQH